MFFIKSLEIDIYIYIYSGRGEKNLSFFYFYDEKNLKTDLYSDGQLYLDRLCVC